MRVGKAVTQACRREQHRPSFPKIHNWVSALFHLHREMSSDLQPADDDRSTSRQEPSSGQSLRDIYSLSTANLKITDDSTPICAKILHPGLMSEFASPYGFPSLPNLLKLTSFARIYAMHMPIGTSGKTFFEYERMTEGVYTFIASSLVDISPLMYNSEFPKWPLEIKVEGGHIGRTSVSTVSTMLTPSDPDRRELLKQITQIVLVSKQTRRPVPVADRWRDIYGPHCIRGEPLIIKPQAVPESGHLSLYDVKIAWSDTDFYKHTNFASYPRFALDAVHDALRHERLNGLLSEADFSSGVSQVKMAYLGESIEGDALRIQVWCPESTERTVVCSMEKEGQTINQVTLTFFPGAAGSGNRNL